MMEYNDIIALAIIIFLFMCGIAWVILDDMNNHAERQAICENICSAKGLSCKSYYVVFFGFNVKCENVACIANCSSDGFINKDCSESCYSYFEKK